MGYKSKIAVPGTRTRRQNPLQSPEMPQEGTYEGRGANGAALVRGYADHEDAMPHGQYMAWQRECLKEMMRLLRPDGAIFYNHKWRVQAGQLQDRHDIVGDFPVRQIIIWQRSGGINFNPGYFLPTYEVIYLIAQPGFRLRPGANALGDVWSIPQEKTCHGPGSEFLPKTPSGTAAGMAASAGPARVSRHR